MINREDFKAEVRSLAKLVKVKPIEVHIRPMKSKWASCSRKGRLSFNDELLTQVEADRRKVIVHELLHLRYPNHGKMFKMMLKKLA